MFSSRVPRDLRPNRLTAALAAHRAAGRPLIDLTLTNPTIAGIDYPPGLLDTLADNAGAVYRPEPFGLASAREAVAQDYARRGLSIVPEHIVLTASTSEAYSLLFKLLCDAGDAVLLPTPSYPLFDHLSSLDSVQTGTYRLEYHGRWMVAEHSVDAAWTARVRAVLAVSPNNPTGSVLSSGEWMLLDSRCAARDAALIVDEVFADYPVSGQVVPLPAGAALTFRLGGLSKSAGLPQVKLGWITVEGPAPLVAEALARLEIICDAYLSVSTPVQVGARHLIERGAAVRGAIQARVRANYDALAARVNSVPSVALHQTEAGWSAVLRVPSTRSEEELVLELLEQHGVLVHPGYFFDFPHEAFLVLGLLTPPGEFDEGIQRLMATLHG